MTGRLVIRVTLSLNVVVVTQRDAVHVDMRRQNLVSSRIDIICSLESPGPSDIQWLHTSLCQGQR